MIFHQVLSISVTFLGTVISIPNSNFPFRNAETKKCNENENQRDKVSINTKNEVIEMMNQK